MTRSSDNLLNRILQDYSQPFSELITRLDQASRGIAKFLSDNPGLSESIRRFVKDRPQILKSAWGSAAMQGWYLPPIAPHSVVEAAQQGDCVLDTYMVSYLDEEWEDLTAMTLRLYPERNKILEVAFLLHRQANYIASIPLFLSQADGICAQNLQAFLFSEHEKRKASVAERVAASDHDLVDSFMSILTLETQIGGSIGNASAAKKANGPNRNGILHGSRKHLDYGTSINGYKALSLLLFMTLCFDLDLP